MAAISRAIDEQRWDAVVRRTELTSGFVYAVRTTGVYCRSSCPSRLPNRKNVLFFTESAAAEQAGFRACKRCEPTAALAPSARRERAAVLRACELIGKEIEPPPLKVLAQAVGLSPSHFHRLFKEVVGVTPRAFAASVRGQRLRERLRSDTTVTQAIYAAGFGSSGRAYHVSDETLGMTPRQYRGGGVGQSIRFAVVECALGWVAVAATDRGVCLIELGDSADALRAQGSSRFPEADLRSDDPDFDLWVREVVRLIAVPGSRLDLPLDIRGTAFQRQVWEALRAIPIGEVATYSEVARRISQPTASRAVAGACAANELAVVIPCHRVVRTGGALGGYRWGVARKRQLLDLESAGGGSVEGGA